MEDFAIQANEHLGLLSKIAFIVGLPGLFRAFYHILFFRVEARRDKLAKTMMFVFFAFFLSIFSVLLYNSSAFFVHPSEYHLQLRMRIFFKDAQILSLVAAFIALKGLAIYYKRRKK